MDFSFIAVQFLSGLTMATLLFLVASGLTLIFGVGNVFNFAHGSFYMLGAYLAYQTVSAWHANFWAAVLVASLGAGILGVMAEFLFLRRIYGRSEEGGFQILLTYSFILVIDDMVKMIWGTEVQVAVEACRFPGIHYRGRRDHAHLQLGNHSHRADYSCNRMVDSNKNSTGASGSSRGPG